MYSGVYAGYTVMSKQRQNITTKMFTHTHNANIYVGANKKQILLRAGRMY